MSQRKEAIKKLEKGLSYKGDYWYDKMVGKIKEAIADLKAEQLPADGVFEIRIPNLKPDEVGIVRVEINAFTKQLLNNLQARRRTN